MPQLDNDRYHKKAKRLVAEAFNDRELYILTATPDDFYVTWFAKVLGNWKALVSTDLIDGAYFEVTYDGDKKQAYVDYYNKVSNTVITDEKYTNGLVGAN